MDDIRKAVWFSMHQPTPEQIKDAARMNYVFVAVEEGIALGSLDLRSARDMVVRTNDLIQLCAKTGAVAIFGEFDVPMLGVIARTAEDIAFRESVQAPENGEGDYPCFASWRVSRFQENEMFPSPHKMWEFIGRLNKDANRYLQ